MLTVNKRNGKAAQPRKERADLINTIISGKAAALSGEGGRDAFSHEAKQARIGNLMRYLNTGQFTRPGIDILDGKIENFNLNHPNFLFLKSFFSRRFKSIL